MSNSCNPWTVAHQALLCSWILQQEHWSVQPFPSPGHLPNSGIELKSPALQADSLMSEPPGKPSFVFLGVSSFVILSQFYLCYLASLWFYKTFKITYCLSVKKMPLEILKRLYGICRLLWEVWLFIGRINTAKISILPKVIYRFHTISLKFPMAFFSQKDNK